VPLEIYPAFLQPDDDVAAFSTLASSLRRMYLHTEQATRFPALLCRRKLNTDPSVATEI